jgi:hypothetical protein
MSAMPERADGAAVLTCFTLPGTVAGILVGAFMHGEGPGVWGSALKGALFGGVGASAVGGLLALALRAGFEPS